MDTRKPGVIIPAVAIAVLLPAVLSAQPLGGDLGDLARIRDGVHSRRISSYDRSGGNNDRFEGIPDGARRTLFEVEGAGIVNHIWITIAPPPPEVSRNDIILRMYWDGSEIPSTSSTGRPRRESTPRPSSWSRPRRTAPASATGWSC